MLVVPTFVMFLVTPTGARALSDWSEGRAPSCGEHFALCRNGRDVRVVGVGLEAFSRGYMLVWVSGSSGKSWGAYNASPHGGASFEIHTGSTTKQSFSISLIDAGNRDTLVL